MGLERLRAYARYAECRPCGASVQNTARSQRLRAGLMYAAPCGGSFVEAQNALISECSLFEGAPCFGVHHVSGCSILRVRCAIIAGILAYD